MGAAHLVTGAFGFSGREIAKKLLAAGHEVRTLTGSPRRDNPFRGRVQTFPLDFADERGLSAALCGVEVLYNTYWVRFNNPAFSQQSAVANTQALFRAAADAGVRRIVHVSITNPSEESPYEYFRGKAVLERSLRESGISHAILRPAVIFGRDDILINNIAWLLRRLPVFGLFGDGSYRLQPIQIEEFADLAVSAGEGTDNVTLDAVGPEIFTFRELVNLLAEVVGRKGPIISVSPQIGFAAARLLGWVLRDIVLTRDEIRALIDDLLVTASPPVGSLRLSAWARENADTLGMRYGNELARRRNRLTSYDGLRKA